MAQRISDKSKEKLYNTVSEEIMDARIRFSRVHITQSGLREQVDEILYELGESLPDKAIKCFK